MRSPTHLIGWLALVPVLGATALQAQQTPGQGQTPYFEFQVDSPATLLSALVQYPPILHCIVIEGAVLAQYVVTPAGLVDSLTFREVRSDNSQFTQAIRKGLRSMRYSPGIVAGKPVRQLVQERFAFAVDVAKARHPNWKYECSNPRFLDLPGDGEVWLRDQLDEIPKLTTSSVPRFPSILNNRGRFLAATRPPKRVELTAEYVVTAGGQVDPSSLVFVTGEIAYGIDTIEIAKVILPPREGRFDLSPIDGTRMPAFDGPVEQSADARVSWFIKREVELFLQSVAYAPGTRQGKAVRSRVRQGFVFSLGDDND